MTKKEILAVVYKMLEQYQGIDDGFLKSVDFRSFNFNRGFCQWVHNRAFPSQDYLSIINELSIDKLNGKQPSDNVNFWYEVYEERQMFELSITPRIEHLKRTITRLEQEVSKDSEAII